MKRIVFVTTNKGKIASAQGYFKSIELVAYNAELIEPRSDSLREIAREKVMQAYRMVKEPCIALDAGFFVKELNGFPKTYVNHALDTIGIEGILKLMEDKRNRECEFRSCLAYFDGVEIEYFESKNLGKLSDKIRGENSEKKWSDLWYIFEPENFDKTLAEFSEEDFDRYNEIKEDSAIKKFSLWFENKENV